MENDKDLLKIENLVLKIGNTEILKNISFSVAKER